MRRFRLSNWKKWRYSEDPVVKSDYYEEFVHLKEQAQYFKGFLEDIQMREKEKR